MALRAVTIRPIRDRRHLASPWQVRWAVNVLMLTILVSLAFDYVDAIRYMMGERAPLNLPTSG